MMAEFDYYTKLYYVCLRYVMNYKDQNSPLYIQLCKEA